MGHKEIVVLIYGILAFIHGDSTPALQECETAPPAL